MNNWLNKISATVASGALLLSMGLGQTYVGSAACQACHGIADVTQAGYNIYESWYNSGHPYKFNVVENDQAPTYPDFVENFEDNWMTELGNGNHSWSEIAGVIGGFGWKARFVGPDGQIVGTADAQIDPGAGHNQFNFYDGVDHGWADYHTSDVKVYNYSCFKCHTTGGDTTGTWLTGVDGLGTFVEGGIGCEACHGPGSDHVAAPSTSNIDRVYEFAHQDNSLGGLEVDGTVITPDSTGDDVNFLCGSCHNRSYTDPINASGGFIRHHEQWDEFVASDHFANGLTCISCHNPHKRVIWDGDGINMECTTCHPNEMATINHAGTQNCVECHMPYAAKSGTTQGQSGYKGDVRSHLWKISVDSESMFTDDGSAVRDDDTRQASLSPAYSCLSCHNDDPDDDIPDMTLEQVVNTAANMHTTPATDPTYVGSETCAACHDEVNADLGYNIVEEWSNSGHPYKFNVVENDLAPTYPDFVENFEDNWLTELGNGNHSWSEIAGVIGGFGWKARFVGPDGQIVGTADAQIDPGAGHNQFNFYDGVDHGWADYHTSDVKVYNYSCFKCHTTGGDTTGTWLTGVDGLGTFVEGGIGCEGCHGPGSNHAQTGDPTYIDRVYEFAHLDNTIGGLEKDGNVITPDPNGDDVNFLCGSCHNRSYTDPINASGGFIRHHEQWDEFSASPHDGILNCTTCHDPHKRVLWNGEGIKIECSSCHPTQSANLTHAGTHDCVECHMPYAAKSGTTQGQSGYKADVRSHIVRIAADTLSMFTDDGSAVLDDDTRPASLSPAYSCLSCHNDDPADGIPDMTLAEAATEAATMHNTMATGEESELPTAFALRQNYPNPFNPTTTIVFDIPEASRVKIEIYDLLGNRVRGLVDDTYAPGHHQISWDGRTGSGQYASAGIYFARLSHGTDIHQIKMVLLK